MATVFAILAILWFTFYPKLNRKALERFYARYTQEHFGHQMNRETTLRFATGYLTINDGKLNNQINVSSIEKMIETENHFFVREHNANTYIVPKNQIDTQFFKNSISKLEILLENETQWQWK